MHADTQLGFHVLHIESVTASIDIATDRNFLATDAVEGVSLRASAVVTLQLDSTITAHNPKHFFLASSSSLDLHAPSALLEAGSTPTITFLDDSPSAFTYTPDVIGNVSQHSSIFQVEGMHPGQRLEVDGMVINQFKYDATSTRGELEFVGPANRLVTFLIDGIDAELGLAIQEDPGGYFAGATTAMPVCFLKGTKIRTDHGDCMIEALQVGDQVVVSNGLGKVKWLGWRTTWTHSVPAAERHKHMPIRVTRSAIADGVPSRDICVSPGHHLLIDGLLVRAFDIVNGKTIIQEMAYRRFEYWHVELETFDVVSAHGVFSESWADGGNRDYFQNVDITSLRATDMERRRAQRPGFMALRQGAALQRIQVKLAKRAERMFAQSHTTRNAKQA